jgi:hypothetical protein
MPVNPEALRSDSLITSDPPSLRTPPISPQAIAVSASASESKTLILDCPSRSDSMGMGRVV